MFSDQLADLPLDAFYRGINHVCPSLIRVEADEVTYNLHIMLRFELENALLEDRISVAELPEAWNEGMERHLGIVPANDAEGVLQDIHWSMGAIGYFPTYSLGNLMSAQIFAQAEAALDNLSGQIAAGNFTDLHDWLRDHIYRHGRKFTAEELLDRMGCGKLSAEPCSPTSAPSTRRCSRKAPDASNAPCRYLCRPPRPPLPLSRGFTSSERSSRCSSILRCGTPSSSHGGASTPLRW